MSRICVKNLPAYVTEEKLKEHFGAQGHVTDAKIMRTSDRKKSRRFGFVGFHSEEEAKIAIKHFNKSYLDTCRLICEPARVAAAPEDDTSRPWSRYSKGSSAYQKAHPNASGENQKETKKKLKIKPGAEEEDDPELAEFLAVMQPRSKSKLWANDSTDINPSTLKKRPAPELSDDEDDDDDEEEDDQTDDQRNETGEAIVEAKEQEEESLGSSGRLFVRNLAYSASEEDLSALFGKFGDLAEVHLVVDKETNRSKGFGYVLFMLPDAADRAMKELDKSTFQGRLLHILPANAPNKKPEEKENKPGNLKQEREAERKKNEASGNTQAWNSLYMRPDTIAENVAKLHGVSKREFMDPEADDLAVRLALGETHVIAETKRALIQQGVNVELLEEVASSKSTKVSRSNVVILVKNLPFTTTEADLLSLFASYGSLGRLILPPSKTIAVVEFLEAFEARRAFESLAYRKFKHVPLYLEWAPQNLLSAEKPETKADDKADVGELIKSQLLPNDHEADSASSRSLFVKNLNFKTTEAGLKKHFEKQIQGGGSVLKVTIKTKPSNSGKTPLSMGFGFVELDSVESAKRVCNQLQGSVLDGHALVLELSRVESSSKPVLKPEKGSSTKLIVRNVAFEATRKDLKQLFSPLGQMKKLKLPKKFDGSHRGFAFVEFVTRQEAQNAFQALASTHLYGRHLVLEWAQEDQSLDDLRAKTASQISNKKRKFND